MHHFRYRLSGTVVTVACFTAPTLPAGAQSDPNTVPQRLPAVEVRGDRNDDRGLGLDQPAATASSLGLKLRDLPASVSVIDQTQMHERGLRTALEATNATVGVAGGILPGSIPRFNIRGFTDNNITLLRDGIRQNTMAQSSRPVDAFVLDRIEVLKGPASMMFGEGAVAGAINYISREPSARRYVEGYASYGSYDNRRLGLSAGGPLADPRFTYQATFGYIDSSGYVNRNNEQILSGSGALRFQPSATFSTSLHFDASSESLESWFGQPVLYDAVVNSVTRFDRSRSPIPPPTH